MRHLPYKVITKKVNLPKDLVGRVELRLPPNPDGTGPAYGAWSHLIEELLKEYLETVESEFEQVEPALNV